MCASESAPSSIRAAAGQRYPTLTSRLAVPTNGVNLGSAGCASGGGGGAAGQENMASELAQGVACPCRALLRLSWRCGGPRGGCGSWRELRRRLDVVQRGSEVHLAVRLVDGDNAPVSARLLGLVQTQGRARASMMVTARCGLVSKMSMKKRLLL